MRACTRVLSAIPALMLAMPVFAQEPVGTPVIWHDRGDAAAPDLVTRRIAASRTLTPPPLDTAVGSPARQAVPGAADTDAARCLASTCRQVPLRETLTAINIGSSRYARAIAGGFAQGAGIDGGGQLTSADLIPVVELRATALTSIRLYRRFDLEAFLPNIGGGRTHADVWFSYLQREMDFFGDGSRAPADLATRFAIAQRSYQASLYRDLTDRAQGGVYAQVMNSTSSRGTNTPDTTIDFRLDTQILSYGGFLAYDTRDNSLGLTRGVDLYGRLAAADGLGRHEGAARYGWIESEFDVRGYTPLGSPRTSLLLRSRGQFKTPKGAGRQIPFYDLSWLGGRKDLRGYDSYRFRGNNVLLLASELQQTVYSITGVRGVEVFASADAGQVWGDARSSTGPVIPDTGDFNARTWLSGLGGGLQYRHSRTVGARVETGRSREGTRVYLSLSRGF